MSAPKKHADRGRRVAAPPETPEIAASLARIGWPVFPVTIYEDESGKRHKVPAVKWKDEATVDVAVVNAWWAGEHSGRWIGVYAGKAGIVVLDVDPGGDDSLAAAGLDVPDTLTYPTHRPGGRHHVYRAPEGIDLTIARGLKHDGVELAGIDVRSGAGLMVYYGHELGKKDVAKLAPAPDWLLVTRDATGQAGDGTDRAPSADEAAFRDRLPGGKPDDDVREVLARVKSEGMTHDDMLEAVTDLVRLGGRGAHGVAVALDAARETYASGWADAGRHWDNAVTGSVKRLGLPPVTLVIAKPQRKELARRSEPAEVEKVKAKRKAEFKVKKNREAVTRFDGDPVDAPDVTPGDRVLEDGPIAAELAYSLRKSWAYSRGYGLMRWRGKKWESAEEHSLIEAVRLAIRDLEVDEHTAAAMRGDLKAIDKARTLLSRNRAANVARLVVGILAEREPTFDDHPDLLNTPSGVVDLRTGKLKKHRPAYYFTKITGAAYDPDADMTRWMQALEAVPKSVRPWLKERFGQAATGYTPDDDTLLIFEGAGSNGKTTIVIGPRRALGDYATTLPERLLLANPGDHPTTLMNLQGARAGFIEELPEGRSLNVKRLKDAVGTPEITAHRMRQDDVTFRTTHCLMVNTNYLPIVAETDHGTWRRLALVRFPYRFVGSSADMTSKRDRVGDPSLKRHFETVDDPGVLRWIVEGAAAWYARGMRFEPVEKRPRKVNADTAGWRMDADPILAYVAERLVRDEGYAITAADMAEDFNLWLTRRGHKEWSQQTINSRMQGHISLDGIERKAVKWSGAVRPSRPSSFSMRPIPKVTTSWRGVRFIDEAAAIPSEAELDAAALADLERRASR